MPTHAPPYELSPTLNVAQNVRAIARDQLAYAQESLERAKNPDKGVYEARKVFKRLRALLRTVKDHIPPALYARENAAFRTMAQTLAPLRDGAVMVETLDSISNQLDDTLVQSIRPILVEQHEATARLFWEGDAVRTVAQQLSTAQHRARFWRIYDEGWRTLRDNLARTYARGKRGLKESQSAPQDPLVLHEWRKSVKHFWYQLTLLKPLDEATLTPMIANWDTLGDKLGKAHDLAVLSETCAGFMNAKAYHALASVLEATQAELEADALTLGATLYAQPIKPLLKDLRASYRRLYTVQDSVL
jgi:CHAD domain-containing protein